MPREGSGRWVWSYRFAAVSAATLGVAAMASVTSPDTSVAVTRPSPLARLQPPALTDPETLTIQGTNRVYRLEDRDYVVKMPSTPLSGGLTLVGGHNIVIIGGEIVDDTPISAGQSPGDAYGLYLKEQTGTVHIEGLWIHGRGIGYAIVLAEANGATVQVQTCRLAPLHPVSSNVHTDGIQSWAGPARLWLRNVTIRTAGVGLQLQPNEYSPVPTDVWDYERVNIVQTTADAYALWKGSGEGSWWREKHSNFWVRNLGHLAWPTSGHWNPGGPADVAGEPLRYGIPPRGSFVQAKDVGVAYWP